MEVAFPSSSPECFRYVGQIQSSGMPKVKLRRMRRMYYRRCGMRKLPQLMRPSALPRQGLLMATFAIIRIKSLQPITLLIRPGRRRPAEDHVVASQISMFQRNFVQPSLAYKHTYEAHLCSLRSLLGRRRTQDARRSCSLGPSDKSAYGNIPHCQLC